MTLQYKEEHWLLTFDLKRLYLNVAINEEMPITHSFLPYDNMDEALQQQILYILHIILLQNYFQYNNELYRVAQKERMFFK